MNPQQFLDVDSPFLDNLDLCAIQSKSGIANDSILPMYTITVVDTDTGAPIENAHVIGTIDSVITDQNGIATFSNRGDDPIKISHVAYEKRTLTPFNNSQINLDKNIESMNTVTITQPADIAATDRKKSLIVIGVVVAVVAAVVLTTPKKKLKTGLQGAKSKKRKVKKRKTTKRKKRTQRV